MIPICKDLVTIFSVVSKGQQAVASVRAGFEEIVQNSVPTDSGTTPAPLTVASGIGEAVSTSITLDETLSRMYRAASPPSGYTDPDCLSFLDTGSLLESERAILTTIDYKLFEIFRPQPAYDPLWLRCIYLRPSGISDFRKHTPSSVLSNIPEAERLAYACFAQDALRELDSESGSPGIGMSYLRYHYIGVMHLHSIAASDDERVPIARMLSILTSPLPDSDKAYLNAILNQINRALPLFQHDESFGSSLPLFIGLCLDLGMLGLFLTNERADIIQFLSSYWRTLMLTSSASPSGFDLYMDVGQVLSDLLHKIFVSERMRVSFIQAEIPKYMHGLEMRLQKIRQ
jgi:hypothetical protein